MGLSPQHTAKALAEIALHASGLSDNAVVSMNVFITLPRVSEMLANMLDYLQSDNGGSEEELLDLLVFLPLASESSLEVWLCPGDQIFNCGSLLA